MLTNIPSSDSSLSVEAVLAGCWSLAVTVSPVEPELEAEQEPGDLSSSGPGPGQMDSGEVGERNSSGIWRCFCILRLAEEEEDLHTGVDSVDTQPLVLVLQKVPSEGS